MKHGCKEKWQATELSASSHKYFWTGLNPQPVCTWTAAVPTSGIYHYAFSLYCTRQGKQSWFGVVREMHAIWGITRILQITPWLYKLLSFTKYPQNHFFSRNSDSYLFKSMVAERSKRQTEFQSPETVLKSGLFGQLSFLTSLLCSLLHISPNPGYVTCSSHEFHKCLWHFSWPMPVK